ncbi:uroporphyrinogen-III synthase [Pseudomonas aeruginosa]|nr:uroporphyrinogen-III synthase [Pseudomonas aeruginosa]
MSGWRLLLTRPDEECAALAASLGEAGVHSSSLPLLAIDPLEETPEQRTLMLDLDRYCAVVVVSKPAARLGWSGSTATGRSRRSRPGAASARRPRRSSRPTAST